MSLVEGSSLDEPRRKILHEKIGRELPDEVYQQRITGRRILVAPQPTDEKWGLLWKPRSTTEREKLQMGAGWVIAVGPLVGKAGAPHVAGSVLCDAPEDLLGHKILFKAFTGVALQMSADEDEWGGSIVCMTDCDVLAIGEELE
jgi:hypothetical protein